MRKYYMLLLIIYYFVFVSVQETMLNLKKSIIMDTKKILVLECVAAKLQISSQELAQWLENRNQAQQFAAKASFDYKLQGFVILTEAVTDLAEDIKKKAASDAQSWSGH